MRGLAAGTISDLTPAVRMIYDLASAICASYARTCAASPITLVRSWGA